MKVLIPYKLAGPELKYCLRGIEKFIDDPEIIIVGDKPVWIKNIEHIPHKNTKDIRFKAKNIFDKIMLGPDEFMFFNDDHFLLEPFSKDTYHYCGTIKEKLDSMPLNASYRPTLENTLKKYFHNPAIKNYDVHCPIYYKKKHLVIMQHLDWNRSGGYCIKTLYAYNAGIEGTYYPDSKIIKNLPEQKIHELIKGRMYFSTANQAMGKAMINVLEEIYPDKSNFEI